MCWRCMNNPEVLTMVFHESFLINPIYCVRKVDFACKYQQQSALALCKGSEKLQIAGKLKHAVASDCKIVSKLKHAVASDCKIISKLKHAVASDCKIISKLKHAVASDCNCCCYTSSITQ